MRPLYFWWISHSPENQILIILYVIVALLLGGTVAIDYIQHRQSTR